MEKSNKPKRERRRFTLRDKENIINYFYNYKDNRSSVIAEATNTTVSHVDKILSKHLNKKTPCETK